MYPPIPNKSRSEPLSLKGKYSIFYVPDNYTVDLQEPHFVTLGKSEEVYSEIHPGWRRLKGSKADIGGPFFVSRNVIINGKRRAAFTYETLDKNWIYSASGDFHFLTPVQMGNFPPPISGSAMDMNRDGATAVALAAPGTSPMNLAVALGELKKDGLPSAIGHTFKQRSSVAKKAGDEYLNVEFGWKPLVRDVTSLATTVTGANKILTQLERDSGRHVRRRVTVSDTVKVHDTELISSGQLPRMAGMSGSIFTNMGMTAGDIKRTRIERKRVWFSGAFTYYLPPDYYSRDAIRRGAARAQILLGTKLTPKVLWDLAPWSWAADWFSNSGDVISNAHRFLSEGLVMHHGYIMEHTVHDYQYEFTGSGPVSSTILRTESKSRVKANPFGFGTDFNSLSGFQTSILVALGLSRGG